jgi:cell division protein FtsI/penicillin-binding protein 2
MPQNEMLTRRLTLVSLVLIGISVVLLARLLSFQFRMDPKIRTALANQAEDRYVQTVEVMPNRGLIYDRKGNLLATNSYDYRVGISPNRLLDRQKFAAELAPLIGKPENEIYHLIEPDENGIFPPWVLLSPRVDFDTGQKIADLDIDGMVLEPLPVRIYPQGALTAQLVGFFAGGDSTRDSRGYYGVEGFYQDLLAGQSKRVTTSSIPLLEEESEQRAGRVRDGISLVLTIDRDVQNLAQDVLNRAVEKYHAKGGTILIMNPRTGEILAIANNPTFNPDDFSPENLEFARNQAVTDMYEPGSIFKVITMAISLDAGTHDTSWTYHDQGCFEAGGVNICNWDRISHNNSQGDVTFSQVFIESLNTGTATIFKEMGPSLVYPKLRDFGIGSPTGVDLEGEEDGILVEMGDSNWSEAQFLNTSYGQGVSVTSLQMLCAVNAIANDGLIMQPHIVKARIDGNQTIVTQPSASRRPISEAAAHTARDIMVQIVNNPNREDLYEFPNYTVAGKTGTAQIPTPYGYDPNGSIASFVGFLPADDPVVSILVKLDSPEGYWGSQTAAPTFQELVDRLVVLMEIPPDALRFELVSEGGVPFAREY